MPDPKPHHQLVLWAVEHAPEQDWASVTVDVCREAFCLLLSEGMDEFERGPTRRGLILLDGERRIWVRDRAEGSETVLRWDGKPFYTLQLTAHQKMAFAALCEAAGKKGVVP